MPILNDFTNACHDTSLWCYEKGKTALCTLKELTTDLDTLTKMTQVAVSSIHYYNWTYDASVLGKLTGTLTNASDMTFYWASSRLPRNIFFPMTRDSIDWNAAQTLLEGALADPITAKDVIDEQRASMIPSKYLNPAYRNSAELAQALTNRVRLHANFTNFDGAKLATLEFPLRKYSLLETITYWNWILVDVTTSAFFLKEWSLLNTGRMAQSLGQFKVFNWVNFQPLEVWVRGTICFGLILNAVEIGQRVLRYDQMNGVEKKKLGLDALANVTDMIYHGASFVKESGLKAIPSGYLDMASIVARSVGIYCTYNKASI